MKRLDSERHRARKFGTVEFSPSDWVCYLEVELARHNAASAFMSIICWAWFQRTLEEFDQFWENVQNDDSFAAHYARMGVEQWLLAKESTLKCLRKDCGMEAVRRQYLGQSYEFVVGARPAIPTQTKKLVFEKHDSCAHCKGKEKLEIDHITPFSIGGTHDIENLQLLCKPCNIRKGNKFVG